MNSHSYSHVFQRSSCRELLSRGLLCLGICASLLGCNNAQQQTQNAQPTANSDGPVSDSPVIEWEAYPEADWEAQLASVRAGDSVRIQVDAPYALNELQLNKLLGLKAGEVLDVILDGGIVRNEDLGLFSEIDGLEHLRIRLNGFTDAQLQDLIKDGNSSLKILNIPNGQFTAQSLGALAKCTALTQLRIGGNQIDDEAAKAIASIQGLRSLHLIGPGISSGGLDQLAKCPKLASFYIDDCELPDEAWERLFTAKPNLHVHIDQHHHDRDQNSHPH